MKLSLFYKSHSADFEWLKWSRDSVRKFASGIFDEIVLCLPEGETFDWPEAKIVHARESFTGYLFQMAAKCYADHFCSGDIIVFNDSDTIFTRRISLADFIQNGKPIWVYTPFEDARKDQSAWIEPMRRFTGKEPTIEAMRRHCFCWPRAFFEKLRAFCRYQHGVELCDYIKAQEIPGSPLALSFSEFNCAGWFSYSMHPDFFTWLKDSEVGQAYVHQGWTHNGGSQLEEDIAKFREFLGSAPEPLPEPQKPAQTISEQIRAHVTALREIVMESKVGRTQMLHQELRAAGLLGAAQVRKNREMATA